MEMKIKLYMDMIEKEELYKRMVINSQKKCIYKFFKKRGLSMRKTIDVVKLFFADVKNHNLKGVYDSIDDYRKK